MKDFKNQYELNNLDHTHTIYDCFIDNMSFKFKDISSSNTTEIVVNELLSNEYGLFDTQLNENETFIDVGANIGIVSIYVKKKFGCKVIAFEPVPENMENFKENIILNGLKLEDFKLHEKAVYDDDGKILKLFKNTENTGGSGVFDQSDDITDTVETIKLSPFLTKDVKYLKLDCELSEYAIIPEIKNNLKNLKYIGIEFHRAEENQNPLDLYKQIRETFTGEMFMSAWDYTGKDILSELLSEDEKYKNKRLRTEYYKDSSPESQWGIVDTNKFKVNKNQSKRFFCVDNFYEDPHAVRELALGATYFEGEGAVGSRTRKQFLFEGVKERFEEIMGKKILETTPDGMGWRDGGINGRFQTCSAGTPLVYHCDSQMWAGMVYLTPDAPPQCGTTFFRHKNTKIRHNSEINWEAGQGLEVFNQNTFLDGTPYEPIDKIGNVFNRLVIFDGGLIHSASEYFGWDLHSSRLFHMFFFNTEN